MWSYKIKKYPNWVLAGNGVLSCVEFDDPVKGYIRLGVNGWVHIDCADGRTHSFSPSMALEIAWNGMIEKDKDEEDA